MKKILLIILMIITLTGCSKTETIKDTIVQKKDIIIDYSSSTSFEKAINDKKEVKGKIVKVLVLEILESDDSEIKFKAGNNLVFKEDKISELNKGDYIVVRILNEPVASENNLEINYETIKIIEIENSDRNEQENNNNENNENTNEETPIEVKKIKMDKASSDYIGLDKTEIEKEFKNKGFVSVELKESKSTDSKNKNDSIKAIEINGKEFAKDDEFDKENKVVITYWKYEKPASEYELAFIRDMSNYDLYYMFDTDTKKVVYFGTNDTYIDRGTYSGDFNSGVTINWSHGEWKEKFVNKDGSNTAMLTDGNGFEWKYEKCDVSKAQKILDSLK